MLSGFTRFLQCTPSPSVISTASASGRWWPQPERCWFSTDKTIAPMNGNITVVETTRGEIQLNKAKAAPQYYTPRGDGKRDAFGLIPWKNGEQIANYPLFEESIQRSKVAWNVYDGLASKERGIYLAHLRAVEERRLTYKCPVTGANVMTISQLLLNEKCCGNACRHCPYEHENVSVDKKGGKIWNGVYYVYELSKHRSRAPTVGIHRRTRLMVVDNSTLGKEAHASGKLAYCIDTYKQGKRQKHMPKAVLGDKILVAIRGQMRKAFVVGAHVHQHYRQHGVPSTDTNNIVLLDEEGNPLGNRVVKPIPAKLLDKRDHAQFAKVLSLANKFF